MDHGATQPEVGAVVTGERKSFLSSLHEGRVVVDDVKAT